MTAQTASRQQLCTLMKKKSQLTDAQLAAWNKHMAAVKHEVSEFNRLYKDTNLS